eukprot:1735293-Prymnesium_polylepis.1
MSSGQGQRRCWGGSWGGTLCTPISSADSRTNDHARITRTALQAPMRPAFSVCVAFRSGPTSRTSRRT